MLSCVGGRASSRGVVGCIANITLASINGVYLTMESATYNQQVRLGRAAQLIKRRTLQRALIDLTLYRHAKQ